MNKKWAWRIAALGLAAVIHGLTGMAISAINAGDPTLVARLLLWLPATLLYLGSVFVLLLAPLVVVGWLGAGRRR